MIVFDLCLFECFFKLFNFLMESFADEAIFHFTVAAAYTAFMFVHTNFDGRHVYIPSTLDSIVRRKFSLPLLGQTEVLLLNNICK